MFPLGEKLLSQLFLSLFLVSLLSGLFWIIFLITKRRSPVFPPTAAVVVGSLYFLSYIPILTSYNLAQDFHLQASNPYTLFEMAVNWPVIEFTAAQAYPGKGYMDTPLLWPDHLWIGGVVFYFWGSLVIAYLVRGVGHVFLKIRK